MPIGRESPLNTTASPGTGRSLFSVASVDAALPGEPVAPSGCLGGASDSKFTGAISSTGTSSSVATFRSVLLPCSKTTACSNPDMSLWGMPEGLMVVKHRRPLNIDALALNSQEGVSIPHSCGQGNVPRIACNGAITLIL